MSKAQAPSMRSPAADGTAAAGSARSESVSPAAVSPHAASAQDTSQEIMQRLQRMLAVTRRFFEIEPTASKPLQRAVRSYPIPAPAAWHWCLRDGAERNRWYHGEYPYSAAAARRDRD